MYYLILHSTLTVLKEMLFIVTMVHACIASIVIVEEYLETSLLIVTYTRKTKSHPHITDKYLCVTTDASQEHNITIYMSINSLPPPSTSCSI